MKYKTDIMDTQKGKEQVEQGGEEGLLGLGEGAVSTPTGPGASSGSRAKRVRLRSSSEGSPEGVAEGIEERTQLLMSRINQNVEEISTYVKREFSKERHGTYFRSRFAVIQASSQELCDDLNKTGKILEKVLFLRQGGLMAEEWDNRMGQFSGFIMQMVKEETQVLFERVLGELKKSEDMRIAQDELRQGDLKRIETLVVEKIKGVESKLTDKFNEGIKKIKEEGVVGRLEEKMTAILADQKKIIEGYGATKSMIKQMTSKLIEMEQWRPDETIEKEVKEITGGLRRMETKLEGVRGIGSKEDVRMVMKEELHDVRRMIDESQRGRIEKMDVDGDEKVSVADRDESTWSQVVRRKLRRGPQAVIEPPAKLAVGEAREKLTGCLNPRDGNIRVKAIRKVGNKFIVEVHDQKDLDMLKASSGFGKAGFKVGESDILRNPRVMVFDVDKELEADDIVKSLSTRNPDLVTGLRDEEIKENFIPRVRLKGSPYTSNWIVEVVPEMYKRLMKSGRMYIGLRSCRIREHLGVTRCFKCQNLGHISKICRRDVACSKCGREGHHAVGCKDTADIKRCVNCYRAGYRDIEHSVNWSGCPCLLVYQKRLESRTNYGH